MKTIISFTLGVLITLSLTVVASQNNIITIFQPTTPKAVMVKEYWEYDYKSRILAETSKGWIVKTASVAQKGSSSNLKVLVIYEKY